MGRMVWFGPPLLAAGFGLPAAAVIAVGVAVVGVAAAAGYHAGKANKDKKPDEPEATPS
jgi:hypothetical protein